MKKIINCGLTAIVVGAALLMATLFGGNGTYMQVQASTATTFISEYKGDVQKASSKYNLYSSVMMAQAALESGWGQSQLTQSANNFFGIKGAYNGQSVSMATVEYNSNGQMVNTTANFKKYPNAYTSFADNGATLRNGTSWNSSYYSGTWKENAASYVDAANALTGKYATAPNYGASLIKLIQQYGIDQLFGESAASSSQATSDSSSSQSAVSTSSSSVSADTAATAAPTVKYYKGSGDQTVSLSSKYLKYYVYNHIKGTSDNEKRYSWKSLGVRKKVSVYLDMRGVKSDSSKPWYRFRFYPSTKAKHFWVYASALRFEPIYSGKTTGTLTANKRVSGALYNHVLGSETLSKKVASVSSLKANQKYRVDRTALIRSASGPVVWYRISFGKHKGWLKQSNVATSPESVAKVDYKGTKAISSAAKANYLYTNVNPSGQFLKHYKLAQVQLNVGAKVIVDKMGYRLSDHSVWYRITTPDSNAKYWVSSKFLS